MSQWTARPAPPPWVALPAPPTMSAWSGLPCLARDADERNGTNPRINDYNDTASHTGGLEYYALGNRVWFDTDNDSSIDFIAESEQPAGTKIGVNGVTLKLYKDNGTGTYVDTGLTEFTVNGGYYLFDTLERAITLSSSLIQNLL